MPTRLLIAAGEAADSADALPFGVRELIDAADEVLVVTPALPTRFEWLASAIDKAREQADERLQAVLGQIEQLGTQASGTVGADDPLLCIRECPPRIPRRPHSRRAAPSGPRRLAGTRIARRVASPVWNSSHRLLAARVALWTKSGTARAGQWHSEPSARH